MNKFKLGIIGCGNMGNAIATGVTTSGTVAPSDLYICDKSADTEKKLLEKVGCRKSGANDMAGTVDILVIAVKPQDFKELAAAIRTSMRSGITLISIMAGVPLKSICSEFGDSTAVVRAMPNMPSFVGEGMTCLSYSGHIQNISDVRAIFESIGKVEDVPEEMMDAVTAVSGSGPAYIFVIARHLADAAVKNGLDKRQADILVRQTIFGAAKMLLAEDMEFDELVSRVASKGGTTEAALSVFQESALDKIVAEAVFAAKKRSEQLSGGGTCS